MTAVRGSAEELNFGPLKELVRHHIESYDHMVLFGLETMFEFIKPVQIYDYKTRRKLRIWLSNPEVCSPVKEGTIKTMAKPLLPFECRQSKVSYSGKFKAEVCFQYDDGPVIREKWNLGQFPVMLMSTRCHLNDADPKKLIACKEEMSEVGGYFILNGIERVFRAVILPKQNFPLSMVRSSFARRSEGYSDYALAMRCVRGDLSSVSVKLYYLRNGSARLGFWMRGREFMLPVGIILKALVDANDREIYESLTCCIDEKYEKLKGAVGTPRVGECAKIILDEVQDSSLFTKTQCLQHIGEHFKYSMEGMEMESNLDVAAAVLKDYIFVHLNNNDEKFNLLIFMLQKLFSLVNATSAPDNPDSLQNQEVLLPGHLITVYLKDKLEDWLRKAKELIEYEMKDKKDGKTFDFYTLSHVKRIIDKNPLKQIGTAIETMLKMGRLATQSPLDLQQKAGYTVQAERLNFLRFISFFRSIHRGASFAGLRTTSVRKLLPESWGFLCPVHTPDGEPCGLLNHMACTASITSPLNSRKEQRDFLKLRESILNVLVGIGMTSSVPKLIKVGPPRVLHVLLDGRIAGVIPSGEAERIVMHLRTLKVSASSVIPDDLEVGYVPLSLGGAYPGLYLFTNASRFIRPVKILSVPPNDSQQIELIGPFEQVFMEIKCPDGGDGGRKNAFPATHEEIHPTGMLSVVANLTPWSEHNQSPRNMYQCQMAKQTMAFSLQSIQCRADQKLYHLQTPQSPIVRTSTYTKYAMDEHPSGTNAIVAVLAYTGYDMEDAMILNKSSVDRGMCRGEIYQSETIDLSEGSMKEKRYFRRSNLNKPANSLIDSDGLPYVGQRINPGDSYCSVYNEITSTTRTTNRKGSEPVIVDYVAVDSNKKRDIKKVNIRFRQPRNPVIGDKFSSRHGQKGVCSQLWPDIDMPFSGTTGMRPDLIINPHAFPSRMTIAMLLESVAAKGGSLHGKFMDATPFANSMKESKNGTENKTLIDELGEMLREKGFNYHGTEVLYSGFYGTELTCKIFMGPVYYQRLRHMVSDKYQVRSTGVVDSTTRQPIKGRKAGGGIRFGEMERDSMLAHGAAYLLHDRLHTCSDYHVADLCTLCGSILTSMNKQQAQKKPTRFMGGLPPGKAPKKIFCHACKTSKGMETVAIPYVFRYLAAELAAMNIQVTVEVKEEP